MRTRCFCYAFSLLAASTISFTSSAFALDVGERLPAFSLTSNKGEQIASEDLKGKVVYIDFWASWCAPCAQSLPWMAELEKKYGENLKVVTINVDEERAAAEKMLAKNQLDLLVGFDPQGALPEKFGVKSMPTSYIVDAQGQVRQIHRGFSDEARGQLEASIESALAGKL
jgi:cytochrome c biogenesis protein CcmG/thiol:disulfide interchange protein DsbE